MTEAALQQLRRGVQIKGRLHRARPRPPNCPSPPHLWARTPPIRYRASIPTSWLEISISQGMNRQVRKMCAAVGLPCLRLVRAAIGELGLGELQPGRWRELTAAESGGPAPDKRRGAGK